MLKNKKNNFTITELALLKKVDAVLELTPKHDIATNGVPAFVDKFNLLRQKRSLAGTQSVVKHQANKQKSAVVNDSSVEKAALANFVSKSLGHFKEYAKEENDNNLKKTLSDLTASNLKRLKPLDMVTNLNSFAETVKTLKADRLIYHGLEAKWAKTLTDKVAHYNGVLPQKAATISDKPVETSNFKTIISDMKDIMTSLNNLIGPYNLSNPEFYASYIRAAEIKTAPPKRSKKSKQATAKTLLPKEKKVPKSRKKKAKTEPASVEAAPIADMNPVVSAVI